MKTSLFLSFILLFVCASAQIPAPTFRWAVPISGALDITDMKVTPAGDTYITGYFEDYICFDTTWAHCQEGLGEGTDQYIAKYNRDGVLQWAKVVGSAYDEGIGFARSLAIDEKGDVYYAWQSYKDFWVGDTMIHNIGGYRFHLKLSGENGDLLFFEKYGAYWNRKFVATNGIITGAGFYTTGFPFENDTIITVGGETIRFESESTGLLLCQLSPNNSMIQYKLFPCTGTADVYSLCVLADGTTLLHGNFKDTLRIGDTTFVAKNGGDNFLFAFNNKFQLKWGEVYDKAFDNLYTSILSDSNSFYLFGIVPSGFSEPWMGDTLPNQSTPLAIAAKISADRQIEWKVLSQVNGTGLCRLKDNFYMMSGGNGSAGDTLNFYENDFIYPSDRFQSFIRLDDTLRMVWNKTIFVYDPNAPGIDRGVIPMCLDTLGYLYGYGMMKQFSIYLEDLLVRPLFVTMGTYGEKFIFGMTRDSFLVPNPPPPPIDSIPTTWLLYPNPCTDMLYLSGEWQAGSLILEIYDMAGRQIISKEFDIANAGKQKLSCSLPASIGTGIYYTRLRQRTQNQWFKLIKL